MPHSVAENAANQVVSAPRYLRGASGLDAPQDREQVGAAIPQ